MRERFVDVGGTRLATEAAGAGHPVVFIHAGIADRRMWVAQVPTFAERFRTITYDMRGFGSSEIVDEPFSHGADLTRLLDALSIESAHLIGCSMGGALALQFAIEHGDRVDSLVLVNSGAPGFVPEDGFFEPPEWEELLAAFKAGDLDRTAELEVEMWVTGVHRSADDVPADIRDAVFEMVRQALQTENRRDEYERSLDPPAGTRLDEVRCPTLVVLGQLDRPDMHSISRHLAAGIADTQFATIDDTAHLPNMERPEEFNRIVLDFLAAI